MALQEIIQSDTHLLRNLTNRKFRGEMVDVHILGVAYRQYNEIWPGIYDRLIRDRKNLINMEEFRHADILSKLDFNRQSHLFVKMDPLASTKEHYHYELEKFHVLEGTITIHYYLDGKDNDIQLEPGGSFEIPRLAPHVVETVPGCFCVMSLWPKVHFKVSPLVQTAEG